MGLNVAYFMCNYSKYYDIHAYIQSKLKDTPQVPDNPMGRWPSFLRLLSLKRWSFRLRAFWMKRLTFLRSWQCAKHVFTHEAKNPWAFWRQKTLRVSDCPHHKKKNASNKSAPTPSQNRPGAQESATTSWDDQTRPCHLPWPPRRREKWEIAASFFRPRNGCFDHVHHKKKSDSWDEWKTQFRDVQIGKLAFKVRRWTKNGMPVPKNIMAWDLGFGWSKLDLAIFQSEQLVHSDFLVSAYFTSSNNHCSAPKKECPQTLTAWNSTALHDSMPSPSGDDG